MKTLFLLRHSKTIPLEPGMSDFDRRLTQQGSRDADMLGQHLLARQLKIDLVISSPAKRARETTDLVLRATEIAGEVRYDRRIYDATAGQLLTVISETEPQYETILLVGHNPGLEDLVRSLTGQVESLSTTALAEIVSDDNVWGLGVDGKWTLRRIVTARDLFPGDGPKATAT